MNVMTPLIHASPIATASKHFLSIIGNRSPIQPFAVALLFLLGMPLESMAVSTSPATLGFSATQGGTTPPAQTVTFWKEGDRNRNWSVSATTPWVTVTPASGTIATEQDQITVSVNPTGLTAGAYASSVIISTERLKGRVTKTSIPVTLTVQTDSSTTGFLISPPSLQYSGILGGPNVAAGVTITNTSSAPLTVTWHDNIGWLIATSGDTVTMPPGGSATISHTASMASLWAGNFAGVARVTGGGITRQVPVSIAVTRKESTTPALGLAPTALSFSGTVGSANPAAKTISVANTGAGTLAWTAGDNAAWLTLSPASGTNAGAVTASVTLTGLAAGTYSGTITVAATGATTKTIPVSLTVNPVPAATPVIGLSATSLAFTGTAGTANPANQSFTISNTGSGTLTWTAGDNAAWLTLTPASGTNTGTVIAAVNLTGLAPGTYSGTITAAATGATSRTLTVSLTVSPGTTARNSATLNWGTNTETDLAGYKIYIGAQSGVYGAPIVLGRVNTYQATNLAIGTTYFFSITAYDNAGNESTLSAEVSKSIF